MKNHRVIVLLAVLALASCGPDSAPQTATAAPAPARKSMTERINENNGYKQDAKGNWVPQNDRRSEFESKGEPNFARKGFAKQEYKTGDYARKSWWGNKDYAPKAYAGNTDGSRFQKSAAQQGMGAREAKTTAKVPGPYATDDYSTGAAREAGATQVEKTSNDAIENRRKVFKQPEIVDWREQRSLTMDQSKGILGH